MVELHADVFCETAAVVVLKPDALAAHFAADPSATFVGPFTADQVGKADKEKIKIKTCFCAYVLHSLGGSESGLWIDCEALLDNHSPSDW